MKVNYSPYLLEVDLHDKVDVQSSTATIQDGRIYFKLIKEYPELEWPQLNSNLLRDKLKERREQGEAEERARQSMNAKLILDAKKHEQDIVKQKKMDDAEAERQAELRLKRNEQDCVSVSLLRGV